MPCAASNCAACDSVLLERRRDDVARLHFLPAGALHVQHRRLQHAPEGERLLGFFLLPARELLDGVLEVLVEIPPELRQSAPQAVRMRSPSGSCASAYSRCSSVRCV